MPMYIQGALMMSAKGITNLIWRRVVMKEEFIVESLEIDFSL